VVEREEEASMIYVYVIIGLGSGDDGIRAKHEGKKGFLVYFLPHGWLLDSSIE
jgi:hypothetical protein